VDYIIYKEFPSRFFVALPPQTDALRPHSMSCITEEVDDLRPHSMSCITEEVDDLRPQSMSCIAEEVGGTKTTLNELYNRGR
jgi:hypothetical protein